MLKLVSFFSFVFSVFAAYSNVTSTPLPYRNWKDQRVLFMYAHIDDMEMSSGGLVSLLVSEEVTSQIYIVIMTNGDKGCSNDNVCGNSSNAEIASMRQEEQFKSASILGIPASNIIFLEYGDCMLKSYPQQQILEELIGIIRNIQPHVVFTWDIKPALELIPSEGWGDLGYHPDHQYSGQLTLDATWTSQLTRLWPYTLKDGIAWKPNELYFWAYSVSTVPRYYVDITGNALNKKTEAFLEMKSQYSDANELTREIAFIGNRLGNLIGLPIGHSAELYNYILW